MRSSGGICGGRFGCAWNGSALGAAVGRGAEVVAADRALATEATGVKAAGALFAPPLYELDEWEGRRRQDDDPLANPPGVLTICGSADAPVDGGRAGDGVKASAEGSPVCFVPSPGGSTARGRGL